MKIITEPTSQQNRSMEVEDPQTITTIREICNRLLLR